MTETIPLDKILPQKYPFQLLDRVIEFKPNESLTVLKNITANEWIFESSSYPVDVFPETLIIEAAAQAVLVFYRLNQGANEPDPTIALGKVKVEFFERVNLGDQLQLTVSNFKAMGKSGFANVKAQTTKPVADIDIFASIQ